MKKESIICDGFGKQEKNDDYAHLFVCNRRSMDSSGNGYENDGEAIDLCAKCLGVWVYKNLKESGYDKAEKLLELIHRNTI